jgi:hypothetical protein
MGRNIFSLGIAVSTPKPNAEDTTIAYTARQTARTLKLLQDRLPLYLSCFLLRCLIAVSPQSSGGFPPCRRGEDGFVISFTCYHTFIYTLVQP